MPAPAPVNLEVPTLPKAFVAKAVPSKIGAPTLLPVANAKRKKGSKGRASAVKRASLIASPQKPAKSGGKDFIGLDDLLPVSTSPQIVVNVQPQVQVTQQHLEGPRLPRPIVPPIEEKKETKKPIITGKGTKESVKNTEKPKGLFARLRKR